MNDSNIEDKYNPDTDIKLQEEIRNFTSQLSDQINSYETIIKEIDTQLINYQVKGKSYETNFNEYSAQANQKNEYSAQANQKDELFKQIRITQARTYLKAYIVTYNNQINLAQAAKDQAQDIISTLDEIYSEYANILAVDKSELENCIKDTKTNSIKYQKEINKIKNILGYIQTIQTNIDSLIEYTQDPQKPLDKNAYEGLPGFTEAAYKTLESLQEMYKISKKKYDTKYNTLEHMSPEDIIKNFNNESAIYNICNVFANSASAGYCNKLTTIYYLEKAGRFIQSAYIINTSIKNHIDITGHIQRTQNNESNDNNAYISNIIESFKPLVRNTLEVAEAYMELHESFKADNINFLEYQSASQQLTDPRHVTKLSLAHNNLLDSRSKIADAFVKTIDKEKENIAIHSSTQKAYSVFDAQNIVDEICKNINKQYNLIQQYCTHAQSIYDKVDDEEDAQKEPWARCTYHMLEITKTCKSILSISTEILDKVNTDISNTIINNGTINEFNCHQGYLLKLISRRTVLLDKLNETIDLLPANYKNRLQSTYNALASCINTVDEITKNQIYPYIQKEDSLNNSDKLVQLIIGLSNFTQAIQELGHACEACAKQACNTTGYN
ncbi:hypothetical protein [Candidatus Cardinium hertigii]|jgi:hypothetical protein|uniref:Uncharacterized protein n=1 Tax=Candidatus Cardinium hertigii TaxID=247481 RepID=A0A3N2QCF8_9BACT|nr:hypothetical protein [Candidatus Cardinium hertigii]ROT47486.1 hypothetical protein EDM02_02430 [Candidatus Cardinium hertigii]